MPLGQFIQTHIAKIFQFDLRYKHQSSTSPAAVHGRQLALIKAMPLAATEGGFSTPNSEVWGNVTALVEVKGGHCKSMRCDCCEKTFSGGVTKQQQPH
jgi:hypothetical protein